MKEIKYYCDYCGEKIYNKRNIKDIKTLWYAISRYWTNDDYDIGGEGCLACFKSYKEWVEKRKLLKNHPKR